MESILLHILTVLNEPSPKSNYDLPIKLIVKNDLLNQNNTDSHNCDNDNDDIVYTKLNSNGNDIDLNALITILKTIGRNVELNRDYFKDNDFANTKKLIKRHVIIVEHKYIFYFDWYEQLIKKNN